MSEKTYRKYLTLGTLRTGKTVESQMCQNQWSEIRYPSVPSVAMKIYGKKAFPRHDETRFKQFLADVMSGKETIKAGQLYPYQLTVGYKEYSDVREAQWQTLLDKERIYPWLILYAYVTLQVVCMKMFQGDYKL